MQKRGKERSGYYFFRNIISIIRVHLVYSQGSADSRRTGEIFFRS